MESASFFEDEEKDAFHFRSRMRDTRLSTGKRRHTKKQKGRFLLFQFEPVLYKNKKARIDVIIPMKFIKKAVLRNRIRRVLKEMVRVHSKEYNIRTTGFRIVLLKHIYRRDIHLLRKELEDFLAVVR